VFVLVRVLEGVETPYYVQNDSNIWIRTGNVGRQIDITSPEGHELLFRKREKSKAWRSENMAMAENNYTAFLERAELQRKKELEIEKEKYETERNAREHEGNFPPFKSNIAQSQLGSNVSLLRIVLQPFYQAEGFVKPLDLESVVAESRSRNNIYCFPTIYHGFESMREGMFSFEWGRNNGEITCQQLFSNGLIYSAHDVLRVEDGVKATHLGWFAGELFVTLSAARKVCRQFEYQGSIIGEISIDKIKDVLILPIPRSMWPGEEKKSMFDKMSWKLSLDTNLLSDSDKLKEFVTEVVRDIHWSFGYKDLQRSIKSEDLVQKGYLRED
jgi:hypothetical protein